MTVETIKDLWLRGYNKRDACDHDVVDRNTNLRRHAVVTINDNNAGADVVGVSVIGDNVAGFSVVVTILLDHLNVLQLLK